MRSLYDQKRDQPQIDRRIAELASRQHGVFTRAQVMGLGATEGGIKWRLKTGRWERVQPRVYRLAGTVGSWRQQALAACLHVGAGSAVSHRAAAALHGIIRLDGVRLEVTVPRTTHHSRSQGVKIHWLRVPISEDDVTTVDGIRVTRPARTLMDVAAVEDAEVVAEMLDVALRRRLVSSPFLRQWLRHPQRKGLRGARVVARLLQTRPVLGRTESPLERSFVRLLERAGLPLPEAQYVVRDPAGRFVGRVDFAYPQARVVIEMDGFEFHDGRSRFDDERARGNDLQALGWCVLRITSAHLERSPDVVASWVREALLSAGWTGI